MLDYIVGLVLVAAPWILGFADGGPQQWVPIIVGVFIIGVSLVTDYELSVVKAIPLGTHLVMDMLSGVLLALSPWIFGFSDEIWWPHVVFGVLNIGVPLISQTRPSYHKQEGVFTIRGER